MGIDDDGMIVGIDDDGMLIVSFAIVITDNKFIIRGLLIEM